jgi:hypothetical protein
MQEDEIEEYIRGNTKYRAQDMAKWRPRWQDGSVGLGLETVR